MVPQGRGEVKQCQNDHKNAVSLTEKCVRDELLTVVLEVDPGMFMAAISLLGNMEF